MRQVAGSFCLLVQVSSDLSVGRSSCGHLWTDGEGSGRHGSGASRCTGAGRFNRGTAPEAMARFAVLRSHLNEGIPLSGSGTYCRCPAPLSAAVAGPLPRRRVGGLTRAQRSDTGQRKLPVELVQVIEGMALRTPRPSIAAIHRSMTALATQHHWTPPSYGSVYGIVRAVESGHGHAGAGRSCGVS